MGRNKGCFLVASKDFLEEVKKVLGGGVKTRKAWEHRKKGWDCWRGWGFLRTAWNGGERGLKAMGFHPGKSGTPWRVEKLRWGGREQGWKGKQRCFSERP